jgi:hypothetical protein
VDDKSSPLVLKTYDLFELPHLLTEILDVLLLIDGVSQVVVDVHLGKVSILVHDKLSSVPEGCLELFESAFHLTPVFLSLDLGEHPHEGSLSPLLELWL